MKEEINVCRMAMDFNSMFRIGVTVRDNVKLIQSILK